MRVLPGFGRRVAVTLGATIVMSGDKTFKQLKEPVRLARETIPGAEFASLPGQSHDAAAEIVAPVFINCDSVRVFTPQ